MIDLPCNQVNLTVVQSASFWEDCKCMLIEFYICISNGKHCMYVDILNHHKMHAVLHKTPPTWYKVDADVVVVISIPHTLGFRCWQSESGWSHRLGAGTRSQVGRKYADTLLPARGPHMSRLWVEITRVDKPSSSWLIVVNLWVEFVRTTSQVLPRKLICLPSWGSMKMSPRVQCDLHMYSGGPLTLTAACQESIYGAWRRSWLPVYFR